VRTEGNNHTELEINSVSVGLSGEFVMQIRAYAVVLGCRDAVSCLVQLC
jgi:hypothetical protein